MIIRPATASDADPIWAVIAPVLEAGETYALPRDWNRDEALAYWLATDREVFVADASGTILGTYYLRPNQLGGGGHVANCGYVTDLHATGRGIARAMCTHSLELAKARGFRAMQYNFVVSTNDRAVALWKSFGFDIVGVLPEAFAHPHLGFVDTLIMYRKL